MISYNKIKTGIILLVAVIAAGGCSYSFTGASVPPHLQTISIPFFDDRSGSGWPNLSEDFTEQLTNKFLEDNTLKVTEKVNADALLECTIVSFTDNPVAISANENVSNKRIQITVKVNYRDLVKKKQIFDRNFSNSGDYPTEGDVVQAREEAIQTAIDLITEDILLGVVSNW